jgi:hypothetical protein
MNDQTEVNDKERAEGQSRLNDGFAVILEKMERDAFEKWLSEDGKWPKAIERDGDSYKLIQANSSWIAWQARAAHIKPCRGIAHPGCDYLTPCGSICNKCGQTV